MTLAIVRFVLKRRLVSAIAIAASMTAAVIAARHVEIRFQYRDFYTYPQNPRLEVFDRYGADFGDPGGYLAVLVEAQDVFAPGVLRYLADLSHALEASPLFSDVKSLATVRLIRAANGDVVSGPLMPKVPATVEEAATLRQTALGSGLLMRRLVSADGRATAVLANMRVPASMATIAQQRDALAVLRAALGAHPPPSGVTARVTGQPVVEVETTSTLIRDLVNLTPITLAVLTLALFLTFRAINGVILVLTTVSVSVLWTAGVFALIGRPVDILGSIIPTVLLVYGAVDPIFVLTRFLGKIEAGRTRRQAIEEAMSEMTLPCFVTSLTTALGFAAFATATLPTIRFFGIILAVGVMLAFLTTMTVLPLLLSITPTPKRAYSSLAVSRIVDGFLARLWSFVSRRKGLVFVAAAALLAVGAAAGSQLRINNEYVGLLPKGEVLSATRAMEQRLSGVVRIILYFEGRPGDMKRPEVLRAMQAVAAAAKQQPIVDSAVSVADLVAEANQAFEGGAPAARRVPDSPQLVAQYLTLVDPADRADFVTEDYARAHLLMLVTDRGSQPVREARAAIQQEIDRQHFERLGVRATWTGTGIIGYYELDRMVAQVFWGFVLAFGLAVLLQWIIFRSLRAALVSIVPNLIPVGACFVTTWAFGLGMRTDNSLFLCISVGGLFNTTIHIVARVVQQLRSGQRNPDEVVERALRTVGPASFYTAMILSLGFTVLVTSGFPGLRQLGLLSMVTLISAFFSDAVFTSTFLRVFYDWRPAVRRAEPALAGAGVIGRAP